MCFQVEDLPTNRAQLARMLAMVQPAYGELLKLGSIPQTHASSEWFTIVGVRWEIIEGVVLLENLSGTG